MKYLVDNFSGGLKVLVNTFKNGFCQAGIDIFKVLLKKTKI